MPMMFSIADGTMKPPIRHYDFTPVHLVAGDMLRYTEPNGMVWMYEAPQAVNVKCFTVRPVRDDDGVLDGYFLSEIWQILPATCVAMTVHADLCAEPEPTDRLIILRD